MPKRIQMSRQRPWRAENPDAVIVSRPSKWGNPFKVGGIAEWGTGERYSRRVVSRIDSSAKAVRLFRNWMTDLHGDRYYFHLPTAPMFDLDELRGRDLACWCPLDQPCHADALLALANPPSVVCPECAQGKTGNCIGWTLDADDNEVACATAEATRSEQ